MKKKTAVAATPHDIRKGVCESCKRKGAELRAPCPGYKTAGECVDWTKPLPKVKRSK